MFDVHVPPYRDLSERVTLDLVSAEWPCNLSVSPAVRMSGQDEIAGIAYAMIESNRIALMATILRLPYTTAIRPSLRGGFRYGLPCLCPISACTLWLQCAESTTHPALPCWTRSPALCRHDPERRGHDPQRADPSSPWTPQ